jgi:hypothetical protein
MLDAGRRPPSYVPTLTEVVSVASAREAAQAQGESIAVRSPSAEAESPNFSAPCVDMDAIVARVQQDLIHKLESELREQLTPLVDEVVKQAVQMAVRDSEMLLKKALRDVVVQQSDSVFKAGAN